MRTRTLYYLGFALLWGLVTCSEPPTTHPTPEKSTAEAHAEQSTSPENIHSKEDASNTTDEKPEEKAILPEMPQEATAPDLRPEPVQDTPGPLKDDAKQDNAPKEAPQNRYTCAKPHPSWLFCDDFEGMAKGWDAWWKASGWTEALGGKNRGRLTVSTQAHGGKYALYMPAAKSAGYQGGDLIWRSCTGTNKPGCKPLKGYKQLYFRSYFRLAKDHKRVHHFLNISGGPIDDYWKPYGNAGCRPNGKRAMGTTVDFKTGTRNTFFYTYFPGMKCEPGKSCSRYADVNKICSGCASKGMPCSKGPECCWGNNLAPKTPAPLPLDRWVCFEMMMRTNDVGQSNGEMAYWMDGKLIHRVQKMMWRTDPKLQLNMVRLQHYNTTGGVKGHSNRIWFDDVVVSTQRIGCQ